MVLIPAQTEYLALRGLTFFWKTLKGVQAVGLNPGLRLLGILPTMYRNRTLQHRNVLAALQGLSIPVFAPVPMSVRTSDAQTTGQAVVELEPENPVAVAYAALAREVDREWQ